MNELEKEYDDFWNKIAKDNILEAAVLLVSLGVKGELIVEALLKAFYDYGLAVWMQAHLAE